MNGSADIVIIVLNWNGWRDTISCLRSLAAVTTPRFNIFVVENGSTDESKERLESFIASYASHPIALLRNEKNLGFAGGNNVAIRRAMDEGAEWVVLLNNDTVVAENFLEILYAAACAQKNVAFANPLIYSGEPPSKKIWFAGGKFSSLTLKGTHARYGAIDASAGGERSPYSGDYATGCCLLAKTELIRRIGFLPEEYFLYYEDAEWSLRAKKAGYSCIVVPRSVIWHKGAASSAEGSETYIRYHVRNGLLFALRNGSILQKCVVVSLSVVRLVWHAAKYVFLPQRRPWAKATIRGIWDAWRHRYGKISV